MAFENVFQNVDFMAPTRAAWQEQANFEQMLGNIAQQYQRNKELELKKLELQNKPIDVSKVAENALVKQNMGMQLNPQEQAAIQTMGQIAQDKMYIDPVTGQMVMQPSPWRALGGAPASQPPSGFGSMMGAPTVTTQGQPLEAPSPAMSMSGAGQPLTYTDDLGISEAPMPSLVQGELLESPYKAGGILKGTPKGLLMEEESRQKMQESFAAEKMKRQMQGLERFNEGQLASANFANRMNETSKIINSLEDKAGDAKTGAAGYAEAILSVVPSLGVTDKLGRAIVKLSANPEQQKYLNAAQNWIRANLRKESGAVIGDQEMIDEYATYFPTAGDTKEVIQQKRDLRKETERGMIAQSAGAYQEAFGKKAQYIKDSQTKTFNSVEEAEAANLPVGTEITINGRRAIVR